MYLPVVVVLRWQLSTRQLLAHPAPSPTVGWGAEMDKRENLWVEIKAVE